MNEMLQKIGILICIVSVSFVSEAQWNLSFESWSNQQFYTHPSTYRSNVAEAFLQTGSPNITEVQGQQGSAVRLENVDDGNGNVITAQITKGPLFHLLGDAESYTGNPDSVRITYRAMMEGSDSATVQLVFTTASGVPSVNTVKLGGNSTSWREYSKKLSITGAPEQLNITVESYNQSQGGAYQIGSVIEIDHIEFTGTSEQPGNNGFEDWYDVESEEPHYWRTPNFLIPTLDAPGSELSVTKVSDGTHGNFATEIKTIEVPFITSSLKFGFLGNGTPPIFGTQGGRGAHHYSKSTSITFDYKYEPQGNDEAIVFARFNDANGDSLNGTTAVLPASTTFTEHELTFDWSGIDAPSSLLLYFSSSGALSNGTGNVNSTLTIDNIHIDGATGIDDPVSGYDNGISVFPNPAEDVVNIRIDNDFQGEAQLTVYDMLGRVVATDLVIDNVPVSVDLSGLESGQYLYKLTTTENAYSGKFVKQ